MTTLDDPRLLRSISHRLAETADRNQVIEEICMLRNLDWGSAAELVDRAASFHETDITRRQTPILALVALSLFIGGVALAAWQLLGLVAVLSALANPLAATFWDIYNLSFGFFDLLANFWGMLGAFVTGLAMVLGSYLGMKQVWVAWLESLENGTLFQPPAESTSGLEPASANEAVFSAEAWIRQHPDDRETADFILSRLERTRNREWVVTALAMSRGLSWQAANELVEAVLRSSGLGMFRQRSFPLAWVFAYLGIFMAGLVICLQYVLVTSLALRWAWVKVTDQYWLAWFLYQVGEHIERAPGPFALFALGLLMSVGGFLALREALPSVYRWLAQASRNKIR